MSKESWLSVIPFINQYPSWAQLVLAACVIIFLCVLFFAYPKHPQDSMTTPVQETKIDKSTKIGTVEGDYVRGDKNVYTTHEVEKETNSERFSSIKYSDIEEAIKKALPLQRDNVRNSFKGIKVSWDTYLRGAKKESQDNISLLLYPVGGNVLDWIHCKVSLKDYPELAVLPEGTKLRVQGEIDEAGSLGVTLINVKLFILETNKPPTKQ